MQSAVSRKEHLSITKKEEQRRKQQSRVDVRRTYNECRDIPVSHCILLCYSSSVAQQNKVTHCQPTHTHTHTMGAFKLEVSALLETTIQFSKEIALHQTPYIGRNHSSFPNAFIAITHFTPKKPSELHFVAITGNFLITGPLHFLPPSTPSSQ